MDHPHPLGLNMVVNFFAATVFSTLMCAFWWFIASQEMSQAVQRKAEMLYTTRAKLEEEPLLRDLATLLDVRVQQAEQALGDVVKDQEPYRQYQNGRLLFMWMAPLIATYAGLLCAAVVYNQTRTHCAGDERHLTFGHWGGLVLVFFSYIPEILFFLYVIERIVPIGDFEIAQRAGGYRSG